ncbi:MAG: hypothetical protein FJ317_03170, partial [SAR202 cluster bacterium]|nr:hypothetical protein [SAR202 cluster bacterium]
MCQAGTLPLESVSDAYNNTTPRASCAVRRPMDTSGTQVDVLDTTAREAAEQRTLEALDFPAVCLRVSGHASFGPARAKLLSLTPSYDPDEVEQLQKETSEGRRLLDEADGLSLSAPEGTAAAVNRAALEGVLTGLELLMVGGTLETLRRTKASVLRYHPLAPMLAGIAESIPDLQDLRTRIGKCIGLRGEVLDGATPQLALIRRQLREAYEQVTEALNRLVQSERGRQALQDQVISIRGDRFVVPVRAEMRGRIPGIVHDASNTGATLYIEPFSTVEMGNHWRELALEEEREVLRVLRELSALVGDAAVEIRGGIEALTRLDIVLARARYSREIRGVTPRAADAHESHLNIVQARHPLLDGHVVPVSLHIGPEWTTLVITGPNTGGKTVAMKTAGLLALMHQSGLQVPAASGTVLPVFDGVHADVGDQQSIQQSVSTFSSHMRNVVAILGLATTKSLVLLDELGTGTDPEEGAALAKGVLAYLNGHKIPTIVTTHHRSVAALAEATPGMANASVDLDPDTLQPNYKLTIGIPGRSYALKVAEGLGMPSEVLKTATDSMAPESLRFEEMLAQLEKERALLQAKTRETEEAGERAEERGRELQRQLDEMAARREELLTAMRQEVLAEYETLRKRLKKAEAALSWSTEPMPKAGDVREASEEVRAVQKEVRSISREAVAKQSVPETQALAKGELVDIRGLAAQGTVVEVDPDGSEAEVAIGNVRLRVDTKRLTRVPTESEIQPVAVGVRLGPSLASADLDVRGMRVEDATFRL